MVSTIISEKERSGSSCSTLISKDCIDLLNFRINEEEKSWRIYENMYLWLENKGYVNAAALWRSYAAEELSHADWAKQYLLRLGIKPTLLEIPPVQTDIVDFPSIIKDSYDHEVKITLQCQIMAKDAMMSGDFMLQELAFKYLKEQNEELGRQQNWVDQLESFGSDKMALRLLDSAMASD